MPVTNQEGKELIQSFEGLYLQPYLCPAGKPTIGYGTMYYPSGVKVTLEDEEITKVQALEYFNHDLIRFESYIQKKAQVNLTANQFAALVSFSYNLGEGCLTNGRGTGVLELTNKKMFEEAAEKMLQYNKATDPETQKLVVVSGLTRRRLAEKVLYLK